MGCFLVDLRGILANYFAYDAAFTGGVLVAAGDVRGAGVAQVLTGAGAGGGPAVEELDALSGARLAAFFAYPQNMTAGVRVGLGRAMSDNRLILLTGQGAQATCRTDSRQSAGAQRTASARAAPGERGQQNPQARP